MSDFLVYVDSNNADTNLFTASNFTVFLPYPITNISKVEVLSAMFPGLNTGAGTPLIPQFLTLDIEELRTPSNIVAAKLVSDGTSKNNMVPSANAFTGSFATIPVTPADNLVYNSNHRVIRNYPSRIDKLDRLTIHWKTPNDNQTFSGIGHNMFILRFETIHVPHTDLEALPAAETTEVHWTPTSMLTYPKPITPQMSEEQVKIIIMGAAFVCILMIIFSRR